MFELRPFGTSGQTDRVGKVFCVLTGDLRRCLICDEVLSRKAAAEHAGRICFPAQALPSVRRARLNETR